MQRDQIKIWKIKIDGINFEVIQDSDGKFIIPEFIDGLGTALKPAAEEWILCRKPLSEKTIAANVLKWGVGGINVDGCRIELNRDKPRKANTEESQTNTYGWAKGGIYKSGTMPTQGRFPANVVHDGSDEVMAGFPRTKVGWTNRDKGNTKNGVTYNNRPDDSTGNHYSDNEGSAARFFYCAKASRRDRDEGLEGFEEKKVNKMGSFGNQSDFDCPDGAHRVGDKGSAKMRNNHPTVKATELMRYLCRLICPPNGTIIDPFMGSGSTGKGAILEGFNFIGIEQDEEYFRIAEARIRFVEGKRDKQEMLKI